MIALTTTSIAWLLFAVIVGGWVVYAFLNLRQSRDELGSEQEMAANRKKYYDDEMLEGPRLTRVLGIGVVLLVVIVIGLPLYWILEPSRLAGATEAQEEIFVEWGSRLFAPTADGGFNCAGCHGGMSGGGGAAAYNLTDPATGEVTAVNWKAPAVNTIFYRFSEDEVRFILVYGRPFSPMSPWGVEGGGPMNDQQIDTLIAYMHSIQIDREDCGLGEDDTKTCPSGHLPTEIQQRHRHDRRSGGRRRHLRARTARRCSISISPAAPTAAPAVTPRAGAGATPASPARVPSAGISPAAPPMPTSRTKAT